jgi:DNA-binding transcriptional LysR family regulator
MSGFRIDVAIRVSGHLEDSSLIAKKLTNLRYAVCCTPSYVERFGVPRTPNDLLRHNCIQFTLSDRVDEWEFGSGEQFVRVPIAGRYRVTSSLAVRARCLRDSG